MALDSFSRDWHLAVLYFYIRFITTSYNKTKRVRFNVAQQPQSFVGYFLDEVTAYSFKKREPGICYNQSPIYDAYAEGLAYSFYERYYSIIHP